MQEEQVIGHHALLALVRHLRIRARVEELSTAQILILQLLDHLQVTHNLNIFLLGFAWVRITNIL